MVFHKIIVLSLKSHCPFDGGQRKKFPRQAPSRFFRKPACFRKRSAVLFLPFLPSEGDARTAKAKRKSGCHNGIRPWRGDGRTKQMEFHALSDAGKPFFQKQNENRRQQ